MPGGAETFITCVDCSIVQRIRLVGRVQWREN